MSWLLHVMSWVISLAHVMTLICHVMSHLSGSCLARDSSLPHTTHESCLVYSHEHLTGPAPMRECTHRGNTRQDGRIRVGPFWIYVSVKDMTHVLEFQVKLKARRQHSRRQSHSSLTSIHQRSNAPKLRQRSGSLPLKVISLSLSLCAWQQSVWLNIYLSICSFPLAFDKQRSPVTERSSWCAAHIWSQETNGSAAYHAVTSHSF